MYISALPIHLALCLN
uniref:Uncharacterized protein n=1 Tax=Arundo donax TaxID=35708 RepID=A0A0A8Z080_ARUDO